VRIPILLHLSTLAEAAPLIAAAVVRRPARGARAWVLVWCAVLLAESGISYWLSWNGVHNLWLEYFFTPVTGATVLWALSFWQTSDLARLTMRLAIVPFLPVWAVLTIFFEDTSFFSRAADSVASLVGLSAAAYTLVARSRTATGDLLRQDWFWVSAGMALYLGTFSMIDPLSALLVGSDPVLMVRAYQFEAVLAVVAFLAIARGMTCTTAT
jgi:hypothetical protein